MSKKRQSDTEIMDEETTSKRKLKVTIKRWHGVAKVSFCFYWLLLFPLKLWQHDLFLFIWIQYVIQNKPKLILEVELGMWGRRRYVLVVAIS